MCFNKLLTFILAIFRPFNLATQCNAESNSPIVGPRHALPELTFLTSNQSQYLVSYDRLEKTAKGGLMSFSMFCPNKPGSE